MYGCELLDLGFEKVHVNYFNIYYKGKIWNLDRYDGYNEWDLLREMWSECDSMDDWKRQIEKLNFQDNDLTIVVHHLYTNDCLVFVNPYGKYPLYYNQKNLFSDTLTFLIDKDIKLDYQYLWQIRMFGYNQNDLTPYEGIRRFLPGYIYQGNFYYPLIEQVKKTKIKKKLPTNKMFPYYLERSIGRRLNTITDDKIGFLLSGWLDSSLLAALVLKINQDFDKPLDIKFYTTNNANDLEYAKEVADYLGIELNYLEYNLTDLSQEEFFEINWTPVDLGSVIPNILLFKKLKEEWIHTVITWDGPDELFRWYKRNSEADFDYHIHDIKNELVYYHFPKLAHATNKLDINLITPYLSNEIIQMALDHDVKFWKEDLKKIAKWLIPDSVINRKKEPLKNVEIREDKKKYQQNLVSDFISRFNKQCL